MPEQDENTKETGKCCCCIDIEFGMKLLTAMYTIYTVDNLVQGVVGIAKGHYHTAIF